MHTSRTKSVICAGLSLALAGSLTFFGPTTSAFADPQSDLAAAAQQLESLGASLSSLESSLEEATEQIEQTDADIDSKQLEIDAANQQLEEKKAQLSSDMRSSYKQGAATILDFIFGSTSPEDFVSRIYYLDKYSEQKAKTINEVKTLEAQLEADKAELESKQATQQEQVNNLSNQVSEYQSKVAEATDTYNALDEEVKAQLAAQESANVQTAIANVEDNQNRNNATSESQATDNGNTNAGGDNGGSSNTDTGNTDNGGSTNNGGNSGNGDNGGSTNTDSGNNGGNSGSTDSGSSDSVASSVAIALAQVGKPYVYGGAGPDSFDCSGLVCYAFGWKYGHSATRMCRGVVDAGNAKYSIDELSYGDLVFMNGDYNDCGHVGIYIGNGKMVHAANPRYGICVSNIFNFYCGGPY